MKLAELAIEVLSEPFKAQEAARKMALCSDLAPKDVEILRRILQPWWDTERDASALCLYLGALGGVIGGLDGQGSPAHRRAGRIAVLCARSALPLVRKQDRSETAEILNTLDAWARSETISTSVNELRKRAARLWRNSPGQSLNKASYAAEATKCAAVLANASAAAIMKNAALHAALHAATACSPGKTKQAGSRDRHLAVLADMIRSEMPVCPIGLR